MANWEGIKSKNSGKTRISKSEDIDCDLKCTCSLFKWDMKKMEKEKRISYSEFPAILFQLSRILRWNSIVALLPGFSYSLLGKFW